MDKKISIQDPYFEELFNAGRELDIVRYIEEGTLTLEEEEVGFLMLQSAMFGLSTLCFSLIKRFDLDMASDNYNALRLLCSKTTDVEEIVSHVFSSCLDSLDEVAPFILESLAGQNMTTCPHHYLETFISEYRLFLPQMDKALYQSVVKGHTENLEILLDAKIPYEWDKVNLLHAWLAIISHQDNEILSMISSLPKIGIPAVVRTPKVLQSVTNHIGALFADPEKEVFTENLISALVPHLKNKQEVLLSAVKTGEAKWVTKLRNLGANINKPEVLFEALSYHHFKLAFEIVEHHLIDQESYKKLVRLAEKSGLVYIQNYASAAYEVRWNIGWIDALKNKVKKMGSLEEEVNFSVDKKAYFRLPKIVAKYGVIPTLFELAKLDSSHLFFYMEISGLLKRDSVSKEDTDLLLRVAIENKQSEVINYLINKPHLEPLRLEDYIDLTVEKGALSDLFLLLKKLGDLRVKANIIFFDHIVEIHDNENASKLLSHLSKLRQSSSFI